MEIFTTKKTSLGRLKSKLFLKTFFIIILSLSTINQCFGQLFKDTNEVRKNLGFFGRVVGLNVTIGLNGTILSHSNQGDWFYTLNQNATVRQHQENTSGTSLSMTVVVSRVRNSTVSILFNMPFKDINAITTDKTSTFFNTQSSFGIGVAIFPIPGLKAFGITVIENFGKVNKLPVENTDANTSDQTFFPIANHPDYPLKVDARVPDALLSPFYQQVNYYSTNVGFIFRL